MTTEIEKLTFRHQGVEEHAKEEARKQKYVLHKFAQVIYSYLFMQGRIKQKAE